jgi:outer membrane protein assembly factor BamD
MTAIVAVSAACGDKETKVTSEEAREGRDRELLSEGIKQLQRGRYDESRLLLLTLINTYPDSQLLPVTKLAVADSYYRQGSTSNLNQSEVEYRDWLQFFPRHELADDVMLKIAEVHMRQMQNSDRDITQAKLAERQLVRILEQYPSSELKERIEGQLFEVREVLALHELKVARFYAKQRQAYKAVAWRTQEILDNYPTFSMMDEALFLRGVAMYEQEDAEEAIANFTRLVRYFPSSQYRDDAISYLQRLDAEVPEAAPESERREQRSPDGFFARVYEVIGHPRIDNIDEDGVLFKKADTVEAATERAMQFSVAPGGTTSVTSTSGSK